MDVRLEVLSSGPLATLQDRGRPGYAHLGVGPSGAADRAAHDLANRIVGNPEDAATIECLMGGLEVVATGAAVIAVTGAPAPVTVNGRAGDHHAPLYVAGGDVVRLGVPPAGLRSYLAVAGGLLEPPVLGSRSWDGMASLGPAPLGPGRVLRVGPRPDLPPAVGLVPVLLPTTDAVALAVLPGPREDWVSGGAAALAGRAWTVSGRSDRVGVRLEGGSLARAPGFADRELPSEGVVRGAVQVPSGGLPVVFLADHPVTGGYPVVAVVVEADADRLAQARPGQQVTFTVVAP